MAVPSYRLLVVDDSKRDTLLLERILQQASDANHGASQLGPPLGHRGEDAVRPEPGLDPVPEVQHLARPRQGVDMPG